MQNSTSGRLLSLDFFRGLIMVLLTLESTYFYHRMLEANPSGFLHAVFRQFDHHPWHGLRFWDLIQPGFMYIAGVALALSLHKQTVQGRTWNQRFSKVLKRSGWLFFWGVLNYAVREQGLSFELWNVLTQLAFTTLVAFLIFEWSTNQQILFSIGLLFLTEVLYRFTGVPSFDQPFTDQHNFGNYVDLLLMNTINKGGWVAINCIPTAVHTIAGCVVGKLLVSEPDEKISLKLIVQWGLITLAAGYLLDLAGVTPIIKRIATSSFVLVSLGYCLLMTALVYWWIDVKKHHRYLFFFTVVGMNSIFIYLFFEIVGHRWFNGYVDAIAVPVFQWLWIPHWLALICSSLVIFALEWLMCYWLYKKQIFFKL